MVDVPTGELQQQTALSDEPEYDQSYQSDTDADAEHYSHSKDGPTNKLQEYPPTGQSLYRMSDFYVYSEKTGEFHQRP